MKNYVFRAFMSLKAIAKQVAVLVVSAVMVLNFAQPAAMAASNSDTQTRLGAPNINGSVHAEDYSAAREKRREWQSRASSVREDQENTPTTLGEKLNVDELSEGYDPSREAEKRSVPTP